MLWFFLWVLLASMDSIQSCEMLRLKAYPLKDILLACMLARNWKPPWAHWLIGMFESQCFWISSVACIGFWGQQCPIHPKGPYTFAQQHGEQKICVAPVACHWQAIAYLAFGYLWIGWFGGQHPSCIPATSSSLASSQGTKLPWRCLVLQQLRSHRWRNNGWPASLGSGSGYQMVSGGCSGSRTLVFTKKGVQVGFSHLPVDPNYYLWTGFPT